MKLLLIGMGPGIGLAIAKRFGREGFEILMVARKHDKLRTLEQELEQEGIKVRSYAADIADEAAFQALLDRLAAEHPDLDILHYNASAFNPAPPSEIAVPVLLNDFKINVVGAVQAYQAFFPHMEARGQGIVFLTGGGTAFQAPPALASLGIGKAGMRNLTFSLAQEAKPHGIHVATVTVCGMVKPGTRHDPVLIADEFWRIYQLPKEQWETEVVWE